LPPKLALALCTGFVIFLLWLERKQSNNVSRALWIPTLWILYVASKPLAAWFPYSGATPESSPLDRAFLIGLMCLALGTLIRRRYDWSCAFKENIPLMALITFMLVSVFWSSIPGTSFFRWIREIQAIIMAFAVLSEISPRREIESILRRATYILIPFSILLIKYFPYYGIEYGRWTGERMWIGVSTQKNGLGLLCTIAIFFLTWSIIKRWREKIARVWRYEVHTEILILVLALWLMRGPGGSFFYSATSFLSLVIGLLFLWGFNLADKYGKRIPASSLMIIIAIIILVGVTALFMGGSNIKFIASRAGRDASFTGRTEVWASLIPVVMKQPFVGGGFGGFWTPRTKEFFHISGAHSGYLDVLLGLGFVGLLLVSIFLLSSSRKAYRAMSNDFHWSVLSTCFIVMAAVHNITESSIDSFASCLTAIVLFFSVSLSTKLALRTDKTEQSR